MGKYYHATRSDWLVVATKIERGDMVRIHPLDGLTPVLVTEALKAQGLKGFIVRDHGTVILLHLAISWNLP